MKNPKIVSSLEGLEHSLTTMRRDGNSTRVIDNVIQLLFKGHKVAVIDPYEWGEHFNANRFLLAGIKKRILSEHEWQYSLLKIKPGQDFKDLKNITIIWFSDTK